MQIAAVIVLAAVLFIAANHYTSRYGVVWWVAHTLVFAILSRVRVVATEHAPAWPPVSTVSPPANQSSELSTP